MRQVIHQAPIYEHVLESYEAETYVKGRTHVPRKNKLLRYAYLVFPIERHPRDAFFEMSGLTRYDAPNHYRNEIVAINSSHLAAGRHYKEIASFVNLNVYSPTIYNKGMIMPLSPDAFKYYTFRQEGTDTISGIPVYNIRFTPRQWSQKLLSGNLYVTDELWTIDRIEVPAFPLPDLPDRAGTKHTGPARLYGKLLADGGRHEPDRTAGLIRTTELQSKRWTLF